MDNLDKDFWSALDELVRSSDLVLDRPKGSPHPRYPDFLYPADYGYLNRTASMDGGGIDVWVGTGPKTVSAILCTVDLLKRDSEIKILLGCTEAESALVCEAHNRTPFQKGILIRR